MSQRTWPGPVPPRIDGTRRRRYAPGRWRFVAVLLLRRSGNLGGGENAIEIRPSEVHDVIDLDPLDALLLTHGCRHDVRAMYTTDRREARREVLLVTFE